MFLSIQHCPQTLRRLLPLIAAAVLTSGCSALSVGEAVTEMTMRPALRAMEGQPSARAVGDQRSPATIYAAVAPSIATISTPGGQNLGSGILLELNDGQKFVLTNAHVVWPYYAVRVVFPDGTELAEEPVRGVDSMTDLALVGPVEVDMPPVTTASGADLPIGSELYLIGYPGETEPFPQPTIARGILSRFRTWEAMDVLYLQTDADIAGGQSGGALVNAAGDVVAMSGRGSSVFAFATALDSIWERIDDMAASQDVTGPDGVRLPLSDRESSDLQRFELQSNLDTMALLFHEPHRTNLWVDAKSWGDLYLSLFDIDGGLLDEVDTEDERMETLEKVLFDPGVYFLVIDQYDESASVVEVGSSAPFTLIVDADDYVTIQVDDELVGYLDYPGDWDTFLINLDEGDTIAVSIESLLVDPYLTIKPVDQSPYLGVGYVINNSEFFGDDELAIYRAPQDGTYVLLIESNGNEDQVYSTMGGYMVRVLDAPEDAVPAPIPLDEPSLETMPADESDELPGESSVGNRR